VHSEQFEARDAYRPKVKETLPTRAEAPTAGVAPVGLKPKDLVGIPWRVAFALQADGWYLRSDVVWSKPNPMPESVTDRPTKSHEYVFLLSKRERYYFDADAVRESVVSGPSDLRDRAKPRGGNLVAERSADCRVIADEGPAADGRSRSERSQPPLGLDDRDAAVPRRAFRHVPRSARRAVREGRHVGARRLPRLRRVVGTRRRA
jgi:hypothetical protein